GELEGIRENHREDQTEEESERINEGVPPPLPLCFLSSSVSA
ncbi:hypothetical protein CSUI_008138, partial [Cystoisospora suis]